MMIYKILLLLYIIIYLLHEYVKKSGNIARIFPTLRLQYEDNFLILYKEFKLIEHEKYFDSRNSISLIVPKIVILVYLSINLAIFATLLCHKKFTTHYQQISKLSNAFFSFLISLVDNYFCEKSLFSYSYITECCLLTSVKDTCLKRMRSLIYDAYSFDKRKSGSFFDASYLPHIMPRRIYTVAPVLLAPPSQKAKSSSSAILNGKPRTATSRSASSALSSSVRSSQQTNANSAMTKKSLTMAHNLALLKDSNSVMLKDGKKMLKIDVPSRAVSRIIGRGGCNIKAIREFSVCKVDLDKNKPSCDDAVVTIRGQPEYAQLAYDLVDTLIKDADCDLESILCILRQHPIGSITVTSALSMLDIPAISTQPPVPLLSAQTSNVWKNGSAKPGANQSKDSTSIAWDVKRSISSETTSLTSWTKTSSTKEMTKSLFSASLTHVNSGSNVWHNSMADGIGGMKVVSSNRQEIIHSFPIDSWKPVMSLLDERSFVDCALKQNIPIPLLETRLKDKEFSLNNSIESTVLREQTSNVPKPLFSPGISFLSRAQSSINNQAAIDSSTEYLPFNNKFDSFMPRKTADAPAISGVMTFTDAPSIPSTNAMKAPGYRAHANQNINNNASPSAQVQQQPDYIQFNVSENGLVNMNLVSAAQFADKIKHLSSSPLIPSLSQNSENYDSCSPQNSNEESNSINGSKLNPNAPHFSHRINSSLDSFTRLTPMNNISSVPSDFNTYMHGIINGNSTNNYQLNMTTINDESLLTNHFQKEIGSPLVDDEKKRSGRMQPIGMERKILLSQQHAAFSNSDSYLPPYRPVSQFSQGDAPTWSINEGSNADSMMCNLPLPGILPELTPESFSQKTLLNKLSYEARPIDQLVMLDGQQRDAASHEMYLRSVASIENLTRMLAMDGRAINADLLRAMNAEAAGKGIEMMRAGQLTDARSQQMQVSAAIFDPNNLELEMLAASSAAATHANFPSLSIQSQLLAQSQQFKISHQRGGIQPLMRLNLDGMEGQQQPQHLCMPHHQQQLAPTPAGEGLNMQWNYWSSGGIDRH